MPIQERIRVFKPSEQLDMIAATTKIGAYEELYQEIFPTCSDQLMLKSLDATIPSWFWNQVSPDYFKFLALMSLQGAQYGFPSLDGHFSRHSEYGWLAHPLHPYHLLASSIYTAKLNVQVFPVKQKYAEELQTKGFEGALGIWGHFFRVEGGATLGLPENVYVAESLARERMHNLRPICMTDVTIAKRLSNIAFSGKQASAMEEETFNNTVLPVVKEQLGHLIDAEMVFQKFSRPRRLWLQEELAWRRFEEVV